MGEEKEVFLMSKTTVKVFGKPKTMIVCAMFIGLSIVLGKYCSITAGPFRISFENLPIIMSGIIFGPVCGALVGAVADLVGCVMVGYSINPFITAGAAVIGAASGGAYRMMKGKSLAKSVAAAVATAHILGSMIIKSVGMNIFYGYEWAVLAGRVPLYILIGALESLIIVMLFKNKGISEKIKGMSK